MTLYGYTLYGNGNVSIINATSKKSAENRLKRVLNRDIKVCKVKLTKKLQWRCR